MFWSMLFKLSMLSKLFHCSRPSCPSCPSCPNCPSCPTYPCRGEGIILEKAPIPRTLDLYISTTQHLLQEFKALHPPSLSNKHDEDYVKLWLIRSHFMVELRSRGIKCIEFDKKAEANKLLNVFPDSNIWIAMMIKVTKAKTIDELLNRLGLQNHNPKALTWANQWLGRVHPFIGGMCMWDDDLPWRFPPSY